MFCVAPGNRRVMARFHPVVAVAAAGLLLAPTAHAARFAPRVSARITDHHVAKGAHPGLSITIRQRRGETPLRTAVVLLPRDIRPTTATLKRTCKLAQVQAGRCPARSRLGSATAVSSALPEPLRGPVVLAEPQMPPEGRLGIGLPNLLIKLHAGATRLQLVAEQRYGATGRLRTLMRNLPPVPVQRFTLRFRSLRDGPLVNPRRLCGHRRQRLDVRLTAQDGRTVRRKPHLQVPC
jgi:hypothetical protein